MKNTILEQLMMLRVNGILNEVQKNDLEYQAIRRQSAACFEALTALNLPRETRHIIDRYISEENALGARYGMLAYLLGFSDCKELFIEKSPFSNIQAPIDET